MLATFRPHALLRAARVTSILAASVGVVAATALGCSEDDIFGGRGDRSGGAGGTAGSEPVAGYATTSTTSSTTSWTTTSWTTTSWTTTSPTTSSTTTSQGGAPPVACDPMHPAIGCGPDLHCVPSETGETYCVGPSGTGAVGSMCTTRDTCQAALECVTATFTSCCMSWCVQQIDCPSATETCTYLQTPVFVGGVEYGVCYDQSVCI